MTIKFGALSVVSLILAASCALAAEFPQSGQAVYETYFISENKATIDGGVGTGEIDVLTGINRNVDGKGPFNDMAVECLLHGTLMDDTWKHYASCVETDMDGDSFFTVSDENNHYFSGGTGKYQGIKGTIPYTIKELHKTINGRQALIITHKASWTIEK